MWKKHKIIMLPANGKSILHKFGDCLDMNAEKQIWHGEAKPIYQHLYILSDEEIKEGDIILTKEYGVWEYRKAPCPLPYWGNSNGCKKIIATTDSSLNLPSISQSFVKKYIEEYNKGNIITDVMVEYDEFVLENNNPKQFRINRYFTDKCEMTGIERDAVEYFVDGGLTVRSMLLRNITIISSLKINSKDNTITIKKVKDSWTREELIVFTRKAITDAFVHPEKFTEGICLDINMVNNWIEENL